MKTEAQIVDEICRDAHNADWSPDTMATLVCEAIAIGVERERARIKEDSPILDWIERKHGDLVWSNGTAKPEPYAGHPGMTRQTGRTAREAFHRAMRIDP